MCFYIHEDHQKVKIARKDITCYKVLRNINSRYYAPYQCVEYRYNKLKKSKIITRPRPGTFGSGTIDLGLHSLTDLKSVKRFINRTLLVYSGDPVFEAVIPKGSEYYYNPYKGEYVSNQLMIVKRIS